MTLRVTIVFQPWPCAAMSEAWDKTQGMSSRVATFNPTLRTTGDKAGPCYIVIDSCQDRTTNKMCFYLKIVPRGSKIAYFTVNLLFTHYHSVKFAVFLNFKPNHTNTNTNFINTPQSGFSVSII